MNRRSSEVRGWVKFPTSSEEFVNSKEGGMFVRLVVIPNSWDVLSCAGGYCHVLYDESYIRDDSRVRHEGEIPETMEGWDAYQKADTEYQKFHFPNLDGDLGKYIDQYLSTAYLATMVLGSTGWSGFSQTRGYWYCTYEDLTDEGKALYDKIQSLYEGTGVLYLQTWLDT